MSELRAYAPSGFSPIVCHSAAKRRNLLLSFALLPILGSTALAQSATACDVRQMGAKGDGHTDDTAALQHAIDTCPPNAGAATVHLTAGTYLSGPLALKSHVHLVLDKGATLLGSTNMADYPVRADAPWRRVSLLHVEHAEDIAITGEGTIDGSGKV